MIIPGRKQTSVEEAQNPTNASTGSSAAQRGVSDWSPSSWQNYQALQQPTYPDEDSLQKVLTKIGKLPPLVTSGEVEGLKAQLAEAQAGRAFVLHGGACAESFSDCESAPLTSLLKVLLQMSLVLIYGLEKPVVRIGRVAGQYAKPRSADMETRDGVTLPSFRGDIVNQPEFTEASRIPDPDRLLQGHFHSAATLNFIRGLIDGGFTDLHELENWNLDFVHYTSLGDEFRKICTTILDAVRFMDTLENGAGSSMNGISLATSHEALHLRYEQAHTRTVPRRHGWYNLSTHFPWIGMRTAALDGSHLEYFRGIRNPLGIKVGPGMTSDWLKGLLDKLNPTHEAGRITLIGRFGAGKVADCLPPLIEAVQQAGHGVVWSSDPMHGNTESTSSGRKTRRFDNIVSELHASFDIHRAAGSHLGGVHLELTGEDVTECIGGARGLAEDELERAYLSPVDPRLNCEQALELALRIVRDCGTGRIARLK